MTSFLTISLSSGSMLTWWAPADGPPRTSPSALPKRSMASSPSPWRLPPTPPTKTASSPWPSTSSPESPSTRRSGCTRMKTVSSLTPKSWWSWPSTTALTAISSTKRPPLTALMYPSSGKCCSTCGSRAFTFSGTIPSTKAVLYLTATPLTAATPAGSGTRPTVVWPTPSS